MSKRAPCGPISYQLLLNNSVSLMKLWLTSFGNKLLVPIGTAVTTYGVVLIISILLPKSNLIKNLIWWGGNANTETQIQTQYDDRQRQKGKEKGTHHGAVLIIPILLPKSNLIKSSIRWWGEAGASANIMPLHFLLYCIFLITHLGNTINLHLPNMKPMHDILFLQGC